MTQQKEEEEEEEENMMLSKISLRGMMMCFFVGEK